MDHRLSSDSSGGELRGAEGLERGFFFQADDFSQHELVLRLCDELEPMLIRVHGDISSKTVELMKYKANAHRDLDRFNEARAVAAQSLKFSEKLSGHSEGYIEGLNTLASISYFERDFEGALKLVEEARALFKPEYDSGILAMLLNLHSNILTSMGRYQDALIAREKNTEMCLRLDGPNHPNYATNCLNIAELYSKLKQAGKAVDFATKSVLIRTKAFGPSHPTTQMARAVLSVYQRALTDPDVKKEMASKSDRMCSVDGCSIVKKSMNRCLKCLSFYLCKKHEGKINEHVVVCPKFPDVLPDEKKIDKILKCRRCRKETKLMKCAVCESVWYCGAQCQKEDWKRHKVFCGKK